MINKASDCIVKNGLNFYKYIIVDEYQDTSFTRYNLLRNICDNIGAKIMVVVMIGNLFTVSVVVM